MPIHNVRDPVHGFIPYDDWELGIINHPAFQRLRRIRQLALTDFVYPGATHTRFEHALGTMHVATQMFDSIVLRQENYLKTQRGYDDSGLRRDRQIVKLAALLHDIGHSGGLQGGTQERRRSGTHPGPVRGAETITSQPRVPALPRLRPREHGL